MAGLLHTCCGRVAAVGLLLLPAAVPAAPAEVSGEQVQRAIRRGVAALLAAQNSDGSWVERNYPGGQTCLATLALLQAGEPPDSPAVARALGLIRRLPDRHTYVVSLKAMVLAQADPARLRRELAAAADWLVAAQGPTGLWGYTGQGERFDHSNSQFALLGLHAAAQAGIRIPPAVWQRAQRRVLETQNGDGGWCYQSGAESYGSMTAAGVADLLILAGRPQQGQERGFHGGAAPNCGKYRASRGLLRGLAWLSRHFRVDVNPRRDSQWHYYWLYSLERCGMLSGQRYFGVHDWYRAGAAYLVRAQGADGLWNRSLTDTCLAVLFLAKGHKSLLIQKLQWSDDEAWNPDRYDVEHLVAFIGDRLGQPVAWQVVPFEAPLEDWLSAPLLYFHGHTFPDWNAAQRAKLRAYVEQGGTLLAEACCGSAGFRAGFERFAAATFPEVPLRELGPEHAVHRLLEDVEPYGLMGLDYACRTAVFYSPRDLSCLWEQADVPGLSQRAFRLGANVAAYAVGRRPLIDRLDAVILPGQQPAAAAPPARDALRLAQVVYEGDWRPFPPALARLSEFLRDELSFDVVTQYRQVRLTDPDLYTCPILYLAGHYDFELGELERAALAGHLRRGGFLIADACCGTEPFDTALRRLVQQMFPDAALERLPADHPILAGTPGFDVTRVQYTPDVLRADPGRSTPELWGLRLDGRLVLVHSPYSLACGLAGPAFDGCWGLASEDARRLAANIVLYALTH